MQVTDAVAGERWLPDGYLAAGVECFRTGAQLHSGDEVGGPTMKLASVYRRPGG